MTAAAIWGAVFLVIIGTVVIALAILLVRRGKEGRRQ